MRCSCVKLAKESICKSMKKEAIILCGFIILKFVLQFILLNPEYELHRDEYLHIDIGQHLAWGYQSVPPLTAWISKIIFLLGNSVFWVKFFPALFGALTILMVWKTIKELNGNLFALILGALCVLLSALLRLNTLYQPNSFDILAWTTLYYVIIKYLNTENTKWLFVAALVVAIGFLNKYNIGFAVIGILPAIILTRQRKIFAEKKLYIALLLGLVIIMPNLLWQYNNDFPVVRHLNELAETQLVNVNRLDFLKSQLLFFAGSLFVIFAGLYALLFYKPFEKFKTFFWAFFFTLIIFLLLRAKDYYAIGLYPVYIAFGSVFLSRVLDKGWKVYLKAILLVFPLLFFISSYNVAYPNKNPAYIIEHSDRYKELGMLRWEDGIDREIPQDYADMLGWKELAKKVDDAYSNMPNPKQTLVLCDNYGQAGAINYYSKKGVRAVSFNADYINWFDLGQPYIHLLRVINANEKEGEVAETGRYFEKTIVVDSITNQYARERGAAITTFINAQFNINDIIREEIQELQR